MPIQDRDWYQREQRDKERQQFGSRYHNSMNWYYRLNGTAFGPCDKDNIMLLLREHRLDYSSQVKKQRRENGRK